MDVHDHRQIHSNKDDSRAKTLLKPTSSDSSDSSMSSVLFSMCPIMPDSNSYLSSTDNQSLVNTSDGEYKHSNANRDSIRSYSTSLDRKIDKDEPSSSDNETCPIERNKSRRKTSQELSTSSRNHSASSIESEEISPNSCLLKLILRPQLFDDSEPCPTAVSPSLLPSCVDPPICPEISPERCQQLQQRQIEFDRIVERLLETITCEWKNNIKQISRYWAYIKQICLDAYQPKYGVYQIFDYLIRSTHVNREYDLYFEENDEIKAALQVLTTTLTITHDHYSFSMLTQIFDDEEKIMREKCQSRLEASLSTYIDQLELIRLSSGFYHSKSNEGKNFQWIQCIQVEYPCFIDKIYNEFYNERPSIPQILVQMLRNTKKICYIFVDK